MDEPFLRESDARRSWEQFLEGTIDTIRRAAGRATNDPEDASDAVAEVLAGFKADWPRLLERYREASRKADADFRVWLSVVARHRAIDFLRSRHGRTSLPRPVSRLPEWKRELWHLVVRRGVELTEAGAELERRGLWRGTLEELAEVALEVRDTADAPRSRPRIVASGGTDEEPALDLPAPAPEPGATVEDNVSREAFRQNFEELSPEDRFLLRTYFLERLTANDVARLTGLQNAEQVYGRVKSLVQRLRQAAERSGLGAEDLAALADFDWGAALEERAP